MQPLVFFPLAIILAAAIVIFGLAPQKWPREPHPVAGEIEHGALVLSTPDFGTPSPSPEQNLTVVRDFWGRPLALRVAVLPNQPAPTPAERGVRILLTPESAALMTDRPVTIEVTYNPLSPNAATGLAVSLQGIAPAEWVTQEIAAQQGVARYELPAQFAVDAIGFRAISDNTDQAYGVEIIRVRVSPR